MSLIFFPPVCDLGAFDIGNRVALGKRLRYQILFQVGWPSQLRNGLRITLHRPISTCSPPAFSLLPCFRGSSRRGQPRQFLSSLEPIHRTVEATRDGS